MYEDSVVEIKSVHHSFKTGNEVVDKAFSSVFSKFKLPDLDFPVENVEIKKNTTFSFWYDYDYEYEVVDLAEYLHEKLIENADNVNINAVPQLSNVIFKGVEFYDYEGREFYGIKTYEHTEKFGLLVIYEKFYVKFLYGVRKGLGFGLEIDTFLRYEIDKRNKTAFVAGGYTPRTYVYYSPDQYVLIKAMEDFEWVVPDGIGTLIYDNSVLYKDFEIFNGMTFQVKWTGRVNSETGHGEYELVPAFIP